MHQVVEPRGGTGSTHQRCGTCRISCTMALSRPAYGLGTRVPYGPVYMVAVLRSHGARAVLNNAISMWARLPSRIGERRNELQCQTLLDTAGGVVCVRMHRVRRRSGEAVTKSYGRLEARQGRDAPCPQRATRGSTNVVVPAKAAEAAG
mgnify:CR=1 FL=1